MEDIALSIVSVIKNTSEMFVSVHNEDNQLGEDYVSFYNFYQIHLI